MATDILTTTVAAPAPHPHSHIPRGLAISDLDLRDDRYPLISSPRYVPPAPRQGTSTNPVSSHTPFYTDAFRQTVRGPSLPSSDSASPQLDIPHVSDERRSMLHPDSQSSRPNASSPSPSYPLDHVQPTNSPPSMNEINLQLFGRSQTSQASSGDLSKAPPTADVPLSTQHPHPRALQPGLPWQSSPRDSHPTELRTPSRSGAPSSPRQGTQLPRPLSPGMRISSPAQYNPAMAIPVTVSSNPRVQAQQPTYINPTPAPVPINPVFTSQPLPAEEVCVECAMRDQDMADVDVTSPGIWARESDVHYDDLLRRELEEEAMGVPPREQQRPRARGGRLTEANLKLWLSLVRPFLLSLHSRAHIFD